MSYVAQRRPIKINYYDSEGNYFSFNEEEEGPCEHKAVDTGFLKSWCVKCNVDMNFNRETFSYEVLSDKHSKGLQETSE